MKKELNGKSENCMKRPTCVECNFFVSDKNSCSTRGWCYGMPVSTVDNDGNDIDQPKYPRRDNSDVVCGLFSRWREDENE